MPFNYSGTMREVQWRALRNWVLRERSSVPARLRAIDAELRRIGSVTFFFEKRTETVQTAEGALREEERATERRLGMSVTPGSSIEKLFQAYIVQGGNPSDVSMFLVPDDVQFVTTDPPENTSLDPNQSFGDESVPGAAADQPYYGVVAPRSAASYGPGGRYSGSLPTFIRNAQTLVGRYIDLSDANSTIAIRTDHLRRWTSQSLAELNRIEHEIRRIADLREQLMQERDTLLVQSVGGSVDGVDTPDPNRYSRATHVCTIVREMDDVFYNKDANGSPDFESIRKGTQDNPEGISTFDSLFDNVDGTDPYSSL